MNFNKTKFMIAVTNALYDSLQNPEHEANTYVRRLVADLLSEEMTRFLESVEVTVDGLIMEYQGEDYGSDSSL